jgi:predicted dehydrogenase
MAGKNGSLRIGFVGAGGIVRQRHVPGLLKSRDVELVGVVNSSPESTHRAAEEFGIQKEFESPDALIHSDDIDIVWIGTQPYLHSKLAIAALEAGKHVFCQARMAMDYADAKRMYEAWKKTGLTAMLCAPPHYMRGDRVVRKMIQDGFIGRPYNVNVRSYADTYHNPKTPVHWRQIASISGVNTQDVGMMIEVVHRWLGYTKRVTAQALTLIPERPPAEVNQGAGTTKVERPDTVATSAEMENGALFSGIWSTLAKFGAEGNGIEMYGSDGTIRYQFGMDAPGSGKVLAGKATDSALKEVDIPAGEARTWTVEQDFIEAIRQGKRDPEPSFWDGLKYMEFTDAVFKSAREGCAVDLPYDPDLKA